MYVFIITKCLYQAFFIEFSAQLVGADNYDPPGSDIYPQTAL